MKRILALMLSLVLALSLFAACGGDTAPAGDARTDVIVNIGSEPTQMNPILSTDTGSGLVNRQIMEPLFRNNQQGVPVGIVAKDEYEVDDDNLGYTFHLREDAMWSNGEPVTAHDFVFAWTTLFTPETAANYAATWATYIEGATDYLNGVEGAVLGFEAIDDYTLHVRLAGPCTYFLNILAMGNLLPINEAFYNEVGADKYGSEVEYILSNGAYKMESWAHDSEIVLVKNEYHRDAENIQIETARLVMISEENSSMNSFRAGEIDVHYTALSVEAAEMMQSEENAVVDNFVDGGLWYIEMNLAVPGLDNLNLRQAIASAVDTQLLCDTLIGNGSVAPEGLVPPSTSGVQAESFHDLVGRTTLPYDVEAAQGYLAAAMEELGVDNAADIVFELIANDTDIYRNISAFVQEQLKTNLGITINVTTMPPKSRIQHLQSSEFELILAGWSPDYNDAMTFLDMWSTGDGNNNSNYSNPEFDALIFGAKAEFDAIAREDMMVEAETILIAEDCVVIPYRWSATSWIYSTGLRGVVRTNLYGMTIADWSWAA